MNRAITWLVLIAAAGVASGLFQVKNKVQRLERQLAVERAAILAERATIEVLEAEWSFLNQPARIAFLAREHLGLEPMAAAQTLRLEQLPRRRDGEEVSQGADLTATPAIATSGP